MHPAARILIVVLGIGLALVALQGAVRGWLPNGPKGFERGEGVHRDRQPIAFWFFFLLYLVGGLYVAGYALRAP